MPLMRTMLVITYTASLLSACAIAPQQTAKPITHNNLNSVLWLQTAAEAQANALQTYHAAMLSIDQAIKDPSWSAVPEQGASAASLPPAIILDVDETVLNNTQYQAQRVIEGNQFTLDSWDQWMAMQTAPAMPGAVMLLNSMVAKGVTVFYITNRACRPSNTSAAPCPQKQDTLENLKKVGIKQVTAENLMLKLEKPEWTSEKQSRRDVIAKHYRVIMLFGDDLGDFLPGVKHITSQQRAALVNQYQSNWGIKWFALANPTYGSWLRVLDNPDLSQYLQGY